jgi:uncharacterized membrane protein YphA (DoxX/SURF4 family)
MKRLIENQRINLAARIVLGAVFIYAAVWKIYDPCDFARAINGYKILPGALINLAAVVLPWMELGCGILVIQGRFSKGAALVMAGMLLMFIAAIGFNLIRGVEFECGCFGAKRDVCDAITRAIVHSRGKLLGQVRGVCDLFRDALILVPAALAIFYRDKRLHPGIE